MAAYAFIIPYVPPFAVEWMNELLQMVFEGCRYNEEGKLIVPDGIIDLNAMLRINNLPHGGEVEPGVRPCLFMNYLMNDRPE